MKVHIVKLRTTATIGLDGWVEKQFNNHIIHENRDAKMKERCGM